MKHTFNVVCVTKRSSKESVRPIIMWHQDMSGEAIVDDVKGTCLFMEKEYPVISSRSGLSSSSLVIGVRVAGSRLDIVQDYNKLGEFTIEFYPSEVFDIWELYTDAPYLGSGKTPEEIQEFAKVAINNPRRYKG